MRGLVLGVALPWAAWASGVERVHSDCPPVIAAADPSAPQRPQKLCCELDYGLPAVLRQVSRNFLLYRFRMDGKALRESTFVMRVTKAGARLYTHKYGMKLIDPKDLLERGAITPAEAKEFEASPYRYLESNAHDFLQAFLNVPGLF